MQFVKVPDVGVPSTGVTNVGVFESTVDPVPVLVVVPVPPCVTASVPVTIVAKFTTIAVACNGSTTGIVDSG